MAGKPKALMGLIFRAVRRIPPRFRWKIILAVILFAIYQTASWINLISEIVNGAFQLNIDVPPPPSVVFPVIIFVICFSVWVFFNLKYDEKPKASIKDK